MTADLLDIRTLDQAHVIRRLTIKTLPAHRIERRIYDRTSLPAAEFARCLGGRRVGVYELASAAATLVKGHGIRDKELGPELVYDCVIAATGYHKLPKLMLASRLLKLMMNAS